MFWADDWTYLHIPKCAGWWVRKVLAELTVEQKHHLNQHAGWRELPAERQRKVCWATLREPASWYRSYLHYNIDALGHPRPILASLVPLDRPIDSPERMRDLLRRWLQLRNRSRSLRVMGPTRDLPLDWTRYHGVGPYTWFVVNALCATDGDPATLVDRCRARLLEVDSLFSTLPVALADLGFDLEKARTACRTVPPQNTNTSVRMLPYFGSVTDELGPDLIAEIYELDRYVVQLGRFKRPGDPA